MGDARRRRVDDWSAVAGTSTGMLFSALLTALVNDQPFEETAAFVVLVLPPTSLAYFLWLRFRARRAAGEPEGETP